MCDGVVCSWSFCGRVEAGDGEGDAGMKSGGDSMRSPEAPSNSRRLQRGNQLSSSGARWPIRLEQRSANESWRE